MLRPIPLHAVPPGPSSLVDQIIAHREAASALAAEHVTALVEALRAVERLSSEISAGGEAYPPGVRDLAWRIGRDLEAKALTLATLMERR